MVTAAANVEKVTDGDGFRMRMLSFGRTRILDNPWRLAEAASSVFLRDVCGARSRMVRSRCQQPKALTPIPSASAAPLQHEPARSYFSCSNAPNKILHHHRHVQAMLTSKPGGSTKCLSCRQSPCWQGPVLPSVSVCRDRPSPRPNMPSIPVSRLISTQLPSTHCCCSLLLVLLP